MNLFGVCMSLVQGLESLWGKNEEVMEKASNVI